jgi:hypothetical protein
MVFLLVGACGDCFFEISGKVTDCSSRLPLQGVSITSRVDRGMNAGKTLPATFTSDANGSYSVHLNEVCSAWVTLMYRKDGYTPLDKQIQGSSSGPGDVCMAPVAGP